MRLVVRLTGRKPTLSFFAYPVVSHLRFFFFNDTATTEIYTLSLHDALPISISEVTWTRAMGESNAERAATGSPARSSTFPARSEEHTSELQSQSNLVCRLLLEKKKKDKEHDCTPVAVKHAMPDAGSHK